MSVVLVCLPGAPKVSEEAVRKDAELNNYLESQVEGEIHESKLTVFILVKFLEQNSRELSLK